MIYECKGIQWYVNDMNGTHHGFDIKSTVLPDSSISWLSITSNSYTRKNPTVDNIRCLLINNGEQQQQQKQLSQFSDQYSNMLIAFCQYGDMVLIVLKNELSDACVYKSIPTAAFAQVELTELYGGTFPMAQGHRVLEPDWLSASGVRAKAHDTIRGYPYAEDRGTTCAEISATLQMPTTSKNDEEGENKELTMRK
ncbi:hypothetical protein Anapl_18652 [Anas platyrhynchos]|uniref:Uncharacterized protein n=1 Tax=Anas platyrhynchos TaxID=8839 RepID=R0JBW5_ANAPL|nr:hypothetical protein Anapl_18652 [Anas platyrhynchos]